MREHHDDNADDVSAFKRAQEEDNICNVIGFVPTAEIPLDLSNLEEFIKKQADKEAERLLQQEYLEEQDFQSAEEVRDDDVVNIDYDEAEICSTLVDPRQRLQEIRSQCVARMKSDRDKKRNERELLRPD